MPDTYITCTVSPCQIVTTLDVPILNLDTEAAGALAVAIIGVWAVGWVFRMLVRVMNVDGVKPDGSGD